MRVYISLDAEGCSGLTRFSQVNPKSSDYGEGREAMLRDVTALIEGARLGGADEIVICDAHYEGNNLPITALGSDVKVIRGTGHPLCMMAGIEEGFDIAFFAGYHARRGTSGVMAHTVFHKVVADVVFDGKKVGEFGIAAGLAAAYGVPAALVTGDDIACAEALELCPDIVTASVKRALGNDCALCEDDETAVELLRDMAEAALKRTYTLVSLPEVVEVTFFHAGQAQMAALVPLSERISDDTIRFNGDDYPEKFQAMLAGMFLASI